MSLQPYSRFYPDIWLSNLNLRSLTRFERNVFLEILCRMWNRSSCSVPDNDRFMARTLEVSVLVWRQVRASLCALRLLVSHDGSLYNPRVFLERQEAEKKSATASRNAQARWSKCCGGNSARRTGQDGRKPLNEKHAKHAGVSDSDTYYLEDL